MIPGMSESPVNLDYIRLRCRALECGCWEWDGYMRTDHRNSPRIVLRRPGEDGVVRPMGFPVRNLVYWLTTGKALDTRRKVVTARCENPLCVAPGCLKVIARGSWSRGKKKPATQAIRISRTRGKKSRVPDEALERFRVPGADVKALAAEYGISVGYAYMLRNRQYRVAASPRLFAGLGVGA